MSHQGDQDHLKQETFESDLHTYSDVLKTLKSNNVKDAKMKKMLKQRWMNKAMNRAKILQKEITHDTEIFEGTFIEDNLFRSFISNKWNDSIEDHTEEITFRNNAIDGVLNGMILNPKNKTNIEDSYDINK